jgi:hypothetical protein
MKRWLPKRSDGDEFERMEESDKEGIDSDSVSDLDCDDGNNSYLASDGGDQR